MDIHSQQKHRQNISALQYKNEQWNEHIDNITASTTKQLNFLKRNLKVTSPIANINERAYLSIVRPRLEYNSCTWDPHQYQIQLEMVQRRAARYVSNRYDTIISSVNSMLTDLNWLALQQSRLQTKTKRRRSDPVL